MASVFQNMLAMGINPEEFDPKKRRLTNSGNVSRQQGSSLRREDFYRPPANYGDYAQGYYPTEDFYGVRKPASFKGWEDFQSDLQSHPSLDYRNQALEREGIDSVTGRDLIKNYDNPYDYLSNEYLRYAGENIGVGNTKQYGLSSRQYMSAINDRNQFGQKYGGKSVKSNVMPPEFYEYLKNLPPVEEGTKFSGNFTNQDYALMKQQYGNEVDKWLQDYQDSNRSPAGFKELWGGSTAGKIISSLTAPITLPVAAASELYNALRPKTPPNRSGEPLLEHDTMINQSLSGPRTGAGDIRWDSHVSPNLLAEIDFRWNRGNYSDANLFEKSAKDLPMDKKMQALQSAIVFRNMDRLINQDRTLEDRAKGKNFSSDEEQWNMLQNKYLMDYHKNKKRQVGQNVVDSFNDANLANERMLNNVIDRDAIPRGLGGTAREKEARRTAYLDYRPTPVNEQALRQAYEHMLNSMPTPQDEWMRQMEGQGGWGRIRQTK